jgi:trk system potassium uptake protein TrkH
MLLRLLGVTEEKTKQIASLSYAVRGRVLMGYLGTFLILLAALASVSALVSIGSGEYFMTVRYAIVIGGLVLGGSLLRRWGRPAALQLNESMVLSALLFVGTPLVMTYPMTAAGLAPLDAFFEAVSAATTTGLSTAATTEGMPATFLFSRAWMQWYGGLGIVFVSLALVVRPGRSAKRLSGDEEQTVDLIGSTRAHARWVLLVYGLLTLAGIALVWGLGTLGLFDAVLYVLSAVSTGGFSPSDASLAALPDRRTPLLITGVALTGSISMVSYRRLYREHWGTVVEDRQLQGLLLLCLLGVLGLYLLSPALDRGPRAWHALLTGLSAQTTTGFASRPLRHVSDAALLWIMGAMFVGGCIGSTAGGLKVFRLLIALRLVLYMVIRTAMPRDAVVNPRLGPRQLDASDLQNALTILLLFVGTIVASWFLFVLWGHDPLLALFEVVSATGTVGLSTGLTRPTLSPVLKGVLCVDMLMGRLEMLAWIVLLYPRTWIGTRRGGAADPE